MGIHSSVKYVKVKFTVENSHQLHTGYISKNLLEAMRKEDQTAEEYLETCTGRNKRRLSSIVLCGGVIVKSCWEYRRPFWMKY